MKIFNSRQNCFCAFCGQKRKVYRLKQAGPIHFLLSLVISVAIMFAVWQDIEPRAIFIFFVVQVATEVVIHFRWRLSLVCTHCGFDPLIYIKDHHRAADKVKNHLDRRKVDPRFLLAPTLNLPHRMQAKPSETIEKKPMRVAQKANKGKLVSKTV